MRVRSRSLLPVLVLAVGSLTAAAQQPERVRPIAPPARPLPSEEESRGIARFSFIVYGDTRGRRDGTDLQYEHSLVVDSMLTRIKALAGTPYPVRFVLQSGDAVMDGRQPGQWNVSFVPLIDRLTKDGGVPYFLAPGNHDVGVAQTADSPDRRDGLRNLMDALSAFIPPDDSPRRLAGYPTYSFGYGNTFVIALDSNVAADEKQFDWVKAQLEGLDRTRWTDVLVFFHHPPFSSGPHGASIIEPPTAALRKKYMPLFRAQHVRAIFVGHEHVFEHWIERYVDAAGAHRMDLVVTGGGGAPPYTYQGEPDLRDYLKANEPGKVAVEHLVKPGAELGSNPYHYVVVRVDGGNLDLEVIAVDWGTSFQPYRGNKMGLQDPVR
jgi:3',5'-cyclic AMP phosphodiesterase CpdA